MANKIQFRRDTAANWTSVNPTISQGELGYETDTTKYKIGDGTTAWTSLAYNTSYSDADVDTHLNTSTATTGEVLSWSGTDYDWIAAGGGGGGATGIDFNDNVKIRFGTVPDLEIYSDGTKSYINEIGTSHLQIQGQEIQFKNAAGTSLMNLSASQIEMLHGGSKKLETTSVGIQTTGTVNVNGAYTLPTTDGTANQVLTTDGAGAVTFATAGGSSPDLYAANDVSATAPSATGDNSVAIGPSSDANSADATAFGYRSEAKASKAVAIGEGRAGGASATAISIGTTSTVYGATGVRSVAMGYQAKATGSSSVAIGNTSVATSTSAFAVGNEASASGLRAVAIGYKASATGSNSYSLSAYGSATRDYSATLFGAKATASIEGKAAYGPAYLVGQGEVQGGMLVCTVQTTDATASTLTTTNGTAGTTNQVILPNNSAYSFSGTIIARQQAADGSNYASWEIKGALLRDANAASTVLGNGIVNKLFATAGASAWAIALTADTTNGGLKIEATGAAATDIRWVATVNTSEVTYA